MKRSTKTKFSSLLAVTAMAGLFSANGVFAGVTPSAVDETMEIGTSMNIDKTVTTPTIPPNPDIIFLADTTGSMGPALTNVKTNAANIISSVMAVQPTAEFGAAQYRDVGDTPLFSIDQSITSNTTDVENAINGWTASGGGDIPEAQINALYELGTDTAGAGYRSGSTRIVVWFGDSSGHDPSNGHSQADAIAALTAAGIKVIAVPVNSGFGDGLDATGQATAITAATSGILLPSATPDEVSAAILSGLGNLPITVSYTVDACAPNLDVTLSPASQTVPSGTDALFTETIAVPNNSSLEGTTQSCTVHFMDEGGNPLGDESITIHIPDTTAPEAYCRETTNPSGKNVPAASDMNQDGFYQLFGMDNVAVSSIVVRDSASAFVSDPFMNGDKIKLTQAPGVTPSDTRPGPGDIVSKLKLNGDAILSVTDTSGNVTEVSCLVPPKPQ